MNTECRLVIITPVRNEGKYLPKMLRSILRQTVVPSEWIIVDDGSSDDSAFVVTEAASKYPWIKVVHRRDRGYRDVGGGVIDALYDGLARISLKEYDFLGKVDGDVVISEKYFETLLRKFSEDPRLGIASGIVVQEEGGRVVRRRCLREFAYGPARLWRRECFEDLGQLFRSPGWDSLDCYEAMRMGWKTWVFEDPDLEIRSMRRIGSSDRSLLRGYLRDGRSAYFRGDHPLYVISSAVYRMADRPYIVCGCCRFIGYLLAAVHRAPRCPEEILVKYIRRWQLNKVMRKPRLKMLV